MKEPKQRLSLTIKGAVQGVGFRPFIYRLATELELVGWVNNSSIGVLIEVEGDQPKLASFLARIQKEKPPRSQIHQIESQWLELVGYSNFEIRHSISGEKTTIVLPDLSTCSDCLAEIFDPHNRRYHYPFTNCTNCGPRYSIIERLPYDRGNTTMKGFSMCPDCQTEYDNPLDRRFHAQPNACPQCGPHLELWDTLGHVLTTHHDALIATAEAIRAGKIVAIKGLGGFHLVVDARNTQAVATLRQRKHRPDKPFALMYPSLNLLKQHCYISHSETQLLLSDAAAIVLLKIKPDIFAILNQTPNIATEDILSREVAPRNRYLGVMLPYTPLHHLLMVELGFPIVATSGNISDEPICIDESEALSRLKQIADLFLIHNRPIKRPVDDSVVCQMGGREMVLRRARGYAPFPIILNSTIIDPTRKNQLSNNSYPSILAVGSHYKNTIAIARFPQVILSQHIGDLQTQAAFNYFQEVINSLQQLYDFNPELIVCDIQPDYLSSQFAQSQNLPIIKVPHHYAHVLSCIAEHRLEPPVLGVAWDGTGYGTDETIWGGEFIHITSNNQERVAHFRTWKLPGAEQAIKEPRRVALGILHSLSLDINKTNLKLAFTPHELALLSTLLVKQFNCPLTSSVGRLFDGVASLLNIRQKSNFEGQAAIELEFEIGDLMTNDYYDFVISSSVPAIIDWSFMIQGILQDINNHICLAKISAKFHNTLVEIIIKIAQSFSSAKIVLSGGCFQNRYLTERAIKRLQQENYSVYWHKNIPPNDGGIALGQIIAALKTI